MSMPDTAPGAVSATEETLRDALAQGDKALGKIGPILSHLLVTPDHSLFSDEIIARIRGMCHSLAWQIFRAQAEAGGQSGQDAFAESDASALAEHFFANSVLLMHCHALALEWQLTERLEIQYGIDPVLSPLIQQLIASDDGGFASAAMAALTAQARFVQTQRRMELPLAELPANLFHDLLMGWRSFNGQLRSDTMIRAEAKLRNRFDEGASRLSLLTRAGDALGNDAIQALDIDEAGAALFLSVLAALSGQSRMTAILSTNDRQIARFALALRSAGLGAEDVERQILRFHPQAVPPREISGLSADDARRLLTETAPSGAAPS